MALMTTQMMKVIMIHHKNILITGIGGSACRSADRKLQMNNHEPVLAEDDRNYLSMTYYMKTLWNLVPIGLILFIMLFSAAVYYLSTAILPGLFNAF